MTASLRVAILIPALNEAATIARVVDEFRAHVPEAEVFVCDNNSEDDTAGIAGRAGATVLHEHRRGKGHAIRRMFADIDADLYLMVDGDATYDPSIAPQMLAVIAAGQFDFVNAARKPTGAGSFPAGHQFGNRVLAALVHAVFGTVATDILSGYKAFSRRFVKTFPALSAGFEIETEIIIHAWDLRIPVYELQAPYRERPAASTSKLRTVRDGLRILHLLSFLIRQDRPLAFFTSVATLLLGMALALGLPVVRDYFATGLVPRLPTAILAATLSVCAVIAFFAGIALDATCQSRREIKRLTYLSIPPSRASNRDRG